MGLLKSYTKPSIYQHCCVDTLRPEQNGWHFEDDIFESIYFLTENFGFKIKFHEECSFGSYQATSHYLILCSPRSLTPSSVTRTQSVRDNYVAQNWSWGQFITSFDLTKRVESTRTFKPLERQRESKSVSPINKRCSDMVWYFNRGMLVLLL